MPDPTKEMLRWRKDETLAETIDSKKGGKMLNKEEIKIQPNVWVPLPLDMPEYGIRAPNQLRRPRTLFCPSMTGRLHVGNAFVLWAVKKYALARGLDWGVRYELGCAQLEPQLPSFLGALYNALERFNSRNIMIYCQGQRNARYWDVINEVIRRGLATWRTLTYLWDDQRPEGFVANVVDQVDFNEVLRIRGFDLFFLERVENLFRDILRHIWPELVGDLRVEYIYMPLIADQEGVILSKSLKPDSAYWFQNWLPGASEGEIDQIFSGWPLSQGHWATSRILWINPEGKVLKQIG